MYISLMRRQHENDDGLAREGARGVLPVALYLPARQRRHDRSTFHSCQSLAQSLVPRLLSLQVVFHFSFAIVSAQSRSFLSLPDIFLLFQRVTALRPTVSPHSTSLLTLSTSAKLAALSQVGSSRYAGRASPLHRQSFLESFPQRRVLSRETLISYLSNLLRCVASTAAHLMRWLLSEGS